MKKIIFIGSPGSGKGTQAELLKKYRFAHLSSGNLIRNSKDPLVIKYRDGGDYEKGILLSDDLIFELLKKEISKLPKESKGYILDGFVRTVPQAKYVKKYGLGEIVICFSVEKDISIKRILKGNRKRTDDNIDSLKGRFFEYETKTNPTIDYLKKNMEFYEIDASKTIEEVNERVLKILKLGG